MRAPIYVDNEGNIVSPPANEVIASPVRAIDRADPLEEARGIIDANVLALTERMLRNGLGARLDGEAPMTAQELRAAEILLNKRLPAAVQQIDINARVEVVERRALLDDIVALLSAPGADTSVLQRAMPSRRARPAADEQLARPDGRGPEDWVPDTR